MQSLDAFQGSGKCFMMIQIGQIGICLPENSQVGPMQLILREYLVVPMSNLKRHHR